MPGHGNASGSPGSKTTAVASLPNAIKPSRTCLMVKPRSVEPTIALTELMYSGRLLVDSKAAMQAYPQSDAVDWSCFMAS